MPVLLVWLVGLVLALARMRTRRRSSALLAVGLGGLLLQRVLLTPLFALLPLWASKRGLAPSTLGLVFGGLGFVESLFSALWFSLILAAALLPEEPTER